MVSLKYQNFFFNDFYSYELKSLEGNTSINDFFQKIFFEKF